VGTVKRKYRAMTTLFYPGRARVDPGEIVDDIPKQSIWWLLRDGLIEEVTEESTSPPQITEESDGS
jgi:hypothetical protein